MHAVLRAIKRVTTPNQPLFGRGFLLLSIFWLIAITLLWELWRAPTIPGIMEVLESLGHQLGRRKFYDNLIASLTLNIKALGIATVLSLAISYLYAVPLLRPVVAFIAKLRFVMIAGLTYLAIQIFTGDSVKVSLLVFGITTFFVTSMAQIVADIPPERYEYARTLRMGEWRIVWEIVILETRDRAIETMRQNNSIGWAMLSMVEVVSRTQGGLGTMLYDIQKWGGPADLFAVELVVLLVGLGFDSFLGLVKTLVNPHLKTREA